MSAVAELLGLDGPVDFDRDHHDRPMIVPPDGGAPIPYTRCSSAGKTIDDTYQLEMWERRNVAYGMAYDPSLVARVLAVGGTPYTWERDDKRAVDGIVVDAARAAHSHRGAAIGTAVHRLTERLDRGEEVAAGIYGPDLEAYRATLAAHGLSVRPEWVEVRIVNDDLQMAGTADRILVRGDECFIGDVKTGSVEHGGLGFATQFAAYAGGVLYDAATGRRLPTPPINQERGVLIHLPAGQGECTLHWVDLAAGHEAALLANRIRAVRTAAKGWITPFEDQAPLVTALGADRVAADAAALRARLTAAVAAGAKRMVWPADVPLFRDGGPRTPDELAAVERCVLDAEREAGMPFAEPVAATGRLALSVVAETSGGGAAASSVNHHPTPGAPLDDLDRLKALHDALPEDLQAAAYGAVMVAGISSDRRTWTVESLPTVESILVNATAEHDARKVRLASALSGLDDDAAVAVMLTVTYGLAPDLDAFRHDQTEQLEALCQALRREPCPLDVDGERLVPNTVAEVAVLRPFGGSKAECLAAAKELARLHSRPAPRSVAAAAADPVLVALLIAGD